MIQPKITPEIRESLGQAVLDFGFMEHLIAGLIKFLSREEPMVSAVVLPGKNVTEYLDILKSLCKARIDAAAFPDWQEAIDDVKNLFAARNTIFHSMVFETSEKILMIKGKRKKPQTGSHLVEFDPNFLADTLLRLAARRRQFLDFMDDFRESDDGPMHGATQDLFPSLRIKLSEASQQRPEEG